MNSDLYIKSFHLKKNEIENYNQYPFCLPVVRHLNKIELKKSITFFVGENGSGKSTLLEALAVCYGFNPEGGSKNFNFSTNNTHSELYQYIALSKGTKKPKDGFFFRAESFYNLATEVDQLDDSLIYSYGGRSLHKQSHGESYIALMMNRFFGNGIYILDEPEAALSPSRQMSLLTGIHDLVKKDSQFIIATHSPILLAYPDAEIYSFSENEISLVQYEETEHYILMKQFLNNKERMLKNLLD